MNEHREQPAPIANASPPIWDLVIRDAGNLYPDPGGFRDVFQIDALIEKMRARDALGRDRYGVPLQAGNGRDALRDAFEEAMDLVAYLRQLLSEGDARACHLYETALNLLVHLHYRYARRGAK